MFRLRKMANLAKGKTLDIGFAAQPNPFLQGEVYGLDRDPVKCPPNYKGTIVHDAMQIANLDDRFDTILAGEIIEHLDQPLSFLEGCYEILNPGGTLVLSTPNPYHPPMVILECLMIRRFFYNSDHVNIFLPRFLVRLMERVGFREIRTLSGGTGIPFISQDFPFPRPISGIIIYTGQKSSPDSR